MKKFLIILISAVLVTAAASAQTYINQGGAQTGSSQCEYLVTIRIHQGTFTLDIFEHIKNKINDVEITIPTTREFYNSVKVDQELSKSFKAGSFLMDGDLSSLKLIIVKKEIKRK